MSSDRPARDGKFRGALLARDGPQCAMCAVAGATGVVSVDDLAADHVVPLWAGGADHPANGQLLCRPHHLTKTQQDRTTWRGHAMTATKASKAGKPGAKGKTPPPEADEPTAAHRAAAAALAVALAGACLWHWAHPWFWPVALLSLLVAAAAALARSVLAARRAVLDTARAVMAQRTHTPPVFLRVRARGVDGRRRGRWAGSWPARWWRPEPAALLLRYGRMFDASDAAARSAVEKAWSEQVGRPIVGEWDQRIHRRTVLLRPRANTDPGTQSAPATETPAADRLEDIGRNLTEQVRAALKDKTATVSITEVDDHGPKTVTIGYGAAVKDSPSSEVRTAALDALHSKLDGRWRLEWRTQQNRVVAHRRPKMPTSVSAAHEAAVDPWRIPLGIDEDGQVQYWDLGSVDPHILVSGATGGGKSVAIAGIAVQAMRRNYDIRLVDGKGSKALAGFRAWSAVTAHGFGDAEEMARVVTDVYNTVRRRYKLVLDGDARTEDLRPILLVLDELTSYLLVLEEHWAAREGKGQHPSIGHLWQILRLGRECRVHVLAGMQQPDAKIFAGTEKRNQFGARLFLGPTTQESARMLFDDVSAGRDVPRLPKGRATASLGEGIVEIQVYWTPPPEVTGEVSDEAWAVLAAVLGVDYPRPQGRGQGQVATTRETEPAQEGPAAPAARPVMTKPAPAPERRLSDVDPVWTDVLDEGLPGRWLLLVNESPDRLWRVIEATPVGDGTEVEIDLQSEDGARRQIMRDADDQVPVIPVRLTL